MDKLKNRRIVVTGSSGFLGTHVCQRLEAHGCAFTPLTRSDYDLGEQAQVRALFRELRPEIVFHIAGYVGGILAVRERPADYFYQNLIMNTLMFEEARQAHVTKLITCIGGCSYPSHAANPIREEDMWNGYPQWEGAPYSVGKRMCIVASEAYRRQYGLDSLVLIPGNIYGPHDNFHLRDAHVVPALVRKFVEAVEAGQEAVKAWGSGRPIRDFIYVADAAEAVVLAAETYGESEIVNISSGQPTSIRQLVETVARLAGFAGRIDWDTSMPDGQVEKLFAVERMRKLLQFEPRFSLEQGLGLTIDWYRAHRASARV